jgi:hypothetical protein
MHDFCGWSKGVSAMVEAIRDQWLIITAVVVLTALLGWLTATRRR